MRRNRFFAPIVAVVGTLCLAVLPSRPAVAQQDDNGQEEAAKLAKEILVTNLQNPCGVAVHEKTGHVFITNRFGLYRFNADAKAVTIEVLNPQGEQTDVYGKGPKYPIGPLGLGWLDEDHLIVGGGSRPDGEELLFVYKIAAEAPEKPLGEDAAAYTLGPIAAQEGVTKMGEGNFYGVAVVGGAIFISTNGDDTKGWIAKAEIQDGKPVNLAPSIATKEAVGVDAPVPLTVSPDGEELVVGQMGEVTTPGDSLLCFYDPASGELKRSFETGLSDICALAYSPKTGKLYAVDFAWLDAAKGEGEEKDAGLFELVIEGDQLTAKEILPLDKPTALAFDKEGNLYITEFGTAEEGSEKFPGTLSVIPASAGL